MPVSGVVAPINGVIIYLDQTNHDDWDETSYNGLAIHCHPRGQKIQDFECVTQQVVMARHTAARIMQQEFKLAGKVESGVPLPTSTSINPQP